MNQLKVNEQQTIIALHERGWSKRKIARDLGLDRVTVRKYIAVALAKSPTPQTGAADLGEAKSPGVQTGTADLGEAKSPGVQTGAADLGEAKSPGVQTGSSASLCERWRERIEQAVEAGLSVQRIYQDLIGEYQFEGSYHSVRRFVLRMRPATELPWRRMECAPGEEMQIDFGQGAWVQENGRRRKTHLFRCVLSASRKAYSEAVWRQDTETFIRCIENAFRHFGGVTATIVIDTSKRTPSRTAEKA